MTIHRLNIIAGDFNKPRNDVEKELISYKHVCSTNENSSNSYRRFSIDHIFAGRTDNIRTANCKSNSQPGNNQEQGWRYKLQNEQETTLAFKKYLEHPRQNRIPHNPSDHGILYSNISVDNANIGIASWNVMTQGLYRLQNNSFNEKKLVDLQTAKVLECLKDILLNPHIDIVCLQEFGGGRNGEVWHNYYNIHCCTLSNVQPKALILWFKTFCQSPTPFSKSG